MRRKEFTVTRIFYLLSDVLLYNWRCTIVDWVVETSLWRIASSTADIFNARLVSSLVPVSVISITKNVP
jgi:hypothetical protein